MSVEIVMPQLGLTMTEGSVSTWLKKPGESVKKDEIILAVATDKVDMDVESPADGTMGEILIEPGVVVPVGTVLTHITANGAEKASIAVPSLQKEPAKEPERAKEVQHQVSDVSVRKGRTVASPRARKIAVAHGVNLSGIQGSGPHGRVVAADVEAVIPKQVAPKEVVGGNARRRQLIADRMVESITTIPSFSVSVEVNATQLVTLYDNLRDHVEKIAGTKLTYTDLLLKSLAVGLSRAPEMNVLWENGASRRLTGITLGMAVATERGVVAPVLHDVDRLSLENLVQTRRRMTQRARESKLTFADLEGASGTLSNLGMYRIDRFEGIITPGQTFILAVGQLKKRPWVVENSLIVASTLVLNLSVDHRAVDGAVAAQFLGQVAEAIESPYQLLWNTDTTKNGN